VVERRNRGMDEGREHHGILVSAIALLAPHLPMFANSAQVLPIVVRNPGAEEGVDAPRGFHAYITQGTGAILRWDQDVARSGRRSLYVRNSGPGTGAWLTDAMGFPQCSGVGEFCGKQGLFLFAGAIAGKAAVRHDPANEHSDRKQTAKPETSIMRGFRGESVAPDAVETHSQRSLS
jgi:hypothetical protein